MTVVEVTIAAAIVMLLLGGGFLSLSMSSEAAYLAAQHTTAAGLCQDRLEQIRAADFDKIDSVTFPSEFGLQLTHTEAPAEVIVLCDRTVDIIDESAPNLGAKRIVVTVHWRFVGSDHEEHIETIVHDL